MNSIDLALTLPGRGGSLLVAVVRLSLVALPAALILALYAVL